MIPLAVDLYCGKGGWTHGLLAAGWDVIGFDIADMGGYPGQLVLQDVLTLHGSQFRNVHLIVASPPCQNYSYLAMPWSRSKDPNNSKRAKALLAKWQTEGPDNRLFDACFRIQREACEAAGRHIPMVVENVKGAQPWVGRAKWHYGSFYLWGDVPALMPPPSVGRKGFGGGWLHDGRNDPRDVRRMPNGEYGIKQGGEWWHDPNSMTVKYSSRSAARKEASARIAMIPFPLAEYIGRVFLPEPIC